MFRPADLDRQLRITLTVALLGAALVAAVGGAVALHPDATLDAEVELVEAGRDPATDRVDQLTLRIANHGDTAIEPVVWKTSTARKAYYPWTVSSGERVPAGATATVVARAPARDHQIRPGVRALVVVSDGQQRAPLSLRFDTVRIGSQSAVS